MNINFSIVQDSGPIYRETIPGRFPVEPWNCFSNLAFLIIITYWLFRIKKSSRPHYFFKFCLFIMSLGFIGGTIYHATRSSQFWLLLDWVPIAFLAFLSAGYLWWLSFKKLWLAAFGVSLPILLQTAVYQFEIFPLSLKISAIYLCQATGILVPLLICLYRHKYRLWWAPTAAICSFTLAIIFRLIDATEQGAILPMGTHFLWHLHGALATQFLFYYLFIITENIAFQSKIR